MIDNIAESHHTSISSMNNVNSGRSAICKDIENYWKMLMSRIRNLVTTLNRRTSFVIPENARLGTNYLFR